jgi:uncharacterized protein DUF4055
MTAPAYNLPYVPDTDPANVGNRPGDGPLRAGGVSLSGMPTNDAKNLPSTPSKAAKLQAPALQIVRDLWGGTETVRAKGTIYLPKEVGEDPQNYESRLRRTVFFNAFRSAIEGLTGFVFRRDPQLGDDVPAAISDPEGHWENIDNAGTHGDVFIRERLQDSLQTGHCAILVEFPNVQGAPLTLADEQGEDPIRPYWVPIQKDQLVSWRTEVVQGKQILTQLVVKEVTTEPDGAFGEVERTRYRVFLNDLGNVSFQLLEVTPTNAVNLIDSGTYPTQTEIPIAEIPSSGRKALFESDPPLIDLAYLNIAFYQRWSDQAESIHMTCVPSLALIGVDSASGDEQKTGDVVIGPKSVLKLPTGGDAKYVSHDGRALDAVKVSLDDMRNDMGVLGLSMLAPQRRTAETAAAKRIDKSATDSKLGVTARALQDGVERALQFHANYLRLPDGGSVEINREFDDMTMQADMMVAWAQLATALNLPIRVVLEALQEGGRISPDEDLDALEKEVAANAAAAQQQKVDEQAAQLSMVRGAGPKAAASGGGAKNPAGVGA